MFAWASTFTAMSLAYLESLCAGATSSAKTHRLIDLRPFSASPPSPSKVARALGTTRGTYRIAIGEVALYNALEQMLGASFLRRCTRVPDCVFRAQARRSEGC
jgi:hypothetical protein